MISGKKDKLRGTAFAVLIGLSCLTLVAFGESRPAMAGDDLVGVYTKEDGNRYLGNIALKKDGKSYVLEVVSWTTVSCKSDKVPIKDCRTSTCQFTARLLGQITLGKEAVFELVDEYSTISPKPTMKVEFGPQTAKVTEVDADLRRQFCGMNAIIDTGEYKKKAK